MSRPLPIDARRVIPAEALSWEATRASGPGGQHVNRTSSKVRLRFDPQQVTWLHPEARERLYRLAGSRASRDGSIVVESQETRDQSRNVMDARRKLAELVAQAMVRPKRRVKTKPTRGSQRRRLDAKKRRSKTKALRGRVRGDD